MTGRPSLLTEDRLVATEQIVVASPEIVTVAGHLGVSRRTVQLWLARGREEQERLDNGEKPRRAEAAYLRFLRSIERGRSQVDVGALLTIANAARGGATKTRTVIETDGNGTVVKRSEQTETVLPDWHAAAWLMERRHPEEYARRIVQVEGGDSPIKVSHSIDEGELAEQVGRMLERMRGAVIDVEPLDELEAGDED